jgi:hypothetical protein
VSKLLPRVFSVTVRLVVAVQAIQTEAPPLWPAWAGSPA